MWVCTGGGGAERERTPVMVNISGGRQQPAYTLTQRFECPPRPDSKPLPTVPTMPSNPTLLLSLERMRCSPVGAPKRASTDVWHGARTNSAHHTVGEVVLSRLLQTSNDGQIHTITQGRYAEALLAELRGVVRIACLGLGAGGTLAPSHVLSLFRATGSSVIQQSAYGSIGLGIESALPHAVAVRVYRELVEATAAVRAMPIGVAMEACLVGQGGSGGGVASDVEAASTIAQCTAAVRAQLFARLKLTDAAPGGGAAAGSSSDLPTAMAYEIVDDAAMPPMDPNQTLQWNIANQIEGRLGRALSLGQLVATHEAMGANLRLVVGGDVDTRRAILERPLLAAMTTRGVLLLLSGLQDALAEAPPYVGDPAWLDGVLLSVGQRVTALAQALAAPDEPGGGGGSGGGGGESGGGGGASGGAGSAAGSGAAAPAPPP